MDEPRDHPPAPQPTRIRFVAGSLLGTEFSLLGAEAVLGRSSHCDLRLDDRADALVSGRHARLYAQDGRWMIEDLQSKNGTFVNGARLAAAHAIEPDDEIGLGPAGHAGACAFTLHDGSRLVPRARARPRPTCPWCETRVDDAGEPCAACRLPASIDGMRDELADILEIRAAYVSPDGAAAVPAPRRGLLNGILDRISPAHATRHAGEEFTEAAMALRDEAVRFMRRDDLFAAEVASTVDETATDAALRTAVLAALRRRLIAGRGAIEGASLANAVDRAVASRARLLHALHEPTQAG